MNDITTKVTTEEIEATADNELEQVEELGMDAGVSVSAALDEANEMSKGDLAVLIGIGVTATATIVGAVAKVIKRHKEKNAESEDPGEGKKSFRSKMSDTKAALKNIWGKSAKLEPVEEEDQADVDELAEYPFEEEAN